MLIKLYKRWLRSDLGVRPRDNMIFIFKMVLNGNRVKSEKGN